MICYFWAVSFMDSEDVLFKGIADERIGQWTVLRLVGGTLREVKCTGWEELGFAVKSCVFLVLWEEDGPFQKLIEGSDYITSIISNIFLIIFIFIIVVIF